MRRKHPTVDELHDRLKHFPKNVASQSVIKKLGGPSVVVARHPTKVQAQDVIVELAKEYLEQLRLVHNARGVCHQKGCFFNPETHKVEVLDWSGNISNEAPQ